MSLRSDQVARKGQGNTSTGKGRGKVVQEKGDVGAEEEES